MADKAEYISHADVLQCDTRLKLDIKPYQFEPTHKVCTEDEQVEMSKGSIGVGHSGDPHSEGAIPMERYLEVCLFSTMNV